jgi:hypothetical protein
MTLTVEVERLDYVPPKEEIKKEITKELREKNSDGKPLKPMNGDRWRVASRPDVFFVVSVKNKNINYHEYDISFVNKSIDGHAIGVPYDYKYEWMMTNAGGEWSFIGEKE